MSTLIARAGVRSTQRGRLISREQPVARHVPFSALYAPDCILLKNNGLMQTIKLQGYRYETADDDSLQYRKEVIAQILKGHADSRFAVWTHLVRRRVFDYPAGEQPPGFARLLDQRWHDRLAEKTLFTNELYITLVRRPGGRGAANALSQALRTVWYAADVKERRAERARMVRELRQFVRELEETLTDYGPEVLTSGGGVNRLLSFAGFLINHRWAPIRPPALPLDQALPRERISFGPRSAAVGDWFANAVSIKEYADHTYPGVLDGLLHIPAEFTVTQSFSFMDRPVAEAWMRRHKRQLFQSADSAEEFVDGARLAVNELATGRVAYGYSHTSVISYGRSREEIDDTARAVSSAMEHAGLVSVIEDVGLEAVFWAALPGNSSYIARSAPISSKNFAGFSSFHNQPAGQKDGNHWGPAVSLIETSGGSPYFWNWHVDDVGHTTVTGVTGSGKTTAVNFFLAQSLKFGGRRVFFDKDRGAEIAIRALGGQYQTLIPGEPTGFNPLQIDDTRANRQFLYGWVKVLLSKGGVREFSDDDDALIEDVVNRVYTLDRADRRLGVIAPWLGREQLRKALGRWIDDGIFAWAFDNAADQLDMDAAIAGFEFGQILDQPEVRTAVMAYLFHRIEIAIDGDPLGIYLEEGWQLLDDPYFERKIKDWLLTLRKRNGKVVFMCQQPSLALDSQVGQLIFNQSPTRLFFPDEKAREAVYVDQLGLSERQYQLIRTTAKESHLFLTVHNRDAVLSRLDLNGMPEIIEVLSGREASVRLLDTIRVEVGDDPADWLPVFYQQLGITETKGVTA